MQNCSVKLRVQVGVKKSANVDLHVVWEQEKVQKQIKRPRERLAWNPNHHLTSQQSRWPQNRSYNIQTAAALLQVEPLIYVLMAHSASVWANMLQNILQNSDLRYQCETDTNCCSYFQKTTTKQSPSFTRHWDLRADTRRCGAVKLNVHRQSSTGSHAESLKNKGVNFGEFFTRVYAFLFLFCILCFLLYCDWVSLSNLSSKTQ